MAHGYGGGSGGQRRRNSREENVERRIASVQMKVTRQITERVLAQSPILNQT